MAPVALWPERIKSLPRIARTCPPSRRASQAQPRWVGSRRQAVVVSGNSSPKTLDFVVALPLQWQPRWRQPEIPRYVECRIMWSWPASLSLISTMGLDRAPRSGST